jgi:uncharacterized protein involved in exopolysaccharide biosynthesis
MTSSEKTLMSVDRPSVPPEADRNGKGVVPSSRADLFDFAAVLATWRRFILVIVSVCTVAALIISVLLPNWYKATARLLPPKDTSPTNMLGAAGSVLRGLGSGRLSALGNQNTGSYNYMAILNSRSAMEAVVRKFNLREVYDVRDTSMQEAINALEDNVSFTLERDDDIAIEVLDKDKQRAADMANYFVDQLNNISNRLATQEASNNRDFIEHRLNEVQADLRMAEDSLRAYQQVSGLIITPDENASSSAIGALYGMKAKKEIEFAILQRTMGEDNPQLHQTEIELDELNKKVSGIPEVGIQSLRFYRRVVIQQKIMEYLVPLFEQARIEQQKDIPVILVLDRAIPPEKKDRPKRSVIVLVVFAASLAFSILIVLMRERFTRMVEDEQQASKVAKVLESFKRSPTVKNHS